VIDLSVLEIVVLFAAAVFVAVVVPPYLPRRAVYAASIGIAFHSLVQIIFEDGPSLWHAVSLLVFSALAVAVWWRDLRGTARDGRPPGR
jgi:hypothetical protein